MYLNIYLIAYMIGVVLAMYDRNTFTELKEADLSTAIWAICLVNLLLIWTLFYLIAPLLIAYKKITTFISFYLIKRKVNQILRKNNIKEL